MIIILLSKTPIKSLFLPRRGKFGVVNLCREKKSGMKLAVKYVEIKTPADRSNMELEIEIMKKLQHPRLIQLYDAFDNGNQIALVLEL